MNEIYVHFRIQYNKLYQKNLWTFSNRFSVVDQFKLFKFKASFTVYIHKNVKLWLLKESKPHEKTLSSFVEISKFITVF